MSKEFSAELVGEKKIKDALFALRVNGIKNVNAVLFKAVQDMRNDVIASMNNTPRDLSKSYGKSGHHPSKPGHPPAPDSGDLIGSIHTDAGHLWAQLYVKGAPYVNALEDGSKAHTIRVRHANFLSDGVTSFGKEVDHPGIKPRPAFKPALKRSQWGREVEQAIQRTLGKL